MKYRSRLPKIRVFLLRFCVKGNNHVKETPIINSIKNRMKSRGVENEGEKVNGSTVIQWWKTKLLPNKSRFYKR